MEDPEEDPEEIEEGPDEIEEEGIEEEEVDEEINNEEEEDDDSDAESELIDPPYMVRVPAHRLGPNDPTPPWAYDLSDGAGTRDSVHRSGWRKGSTTFVMEVQRTEHFLLWFRGSSTSVTWRRRQPIGPSRWGLLWRSLPHTYETSSENPMEKFIEDLTIARA